MTHSIYSMVLKLRHGLFQLGWLYLTIFSCIIFHFLRVLKYTLYRGVRVIVCNSTFNNISVILWLSVLLVGETGVLGENHWPATSQWQTLSHNFVSSAPRHVRNSNSQLIWSIMNKIIHLYLLVFFFYIKYITYISYLVSIITCT